MAIILKDIVKIYETGEVKTYALKKVNLTINNGDLIVVLGPSGSGKSTLLNLISGLDNPTSGEIIVDDQVISNYNTDELTKFRRDNIGFIFQQYHLLQNLTVKENIEIGREISKDPFDTLEVIGRVDMFDQRNKYPSQLSGGEQQRVSIARAVVKKPKIMFCDEPTGALDEETAKEVLSILQNLNEEYNTTLVMITHNPNIALMGDVIIKLNSGEIVEIVKNERKLSAKEISWS